jgi:glycosyltransferase involved in cell wall biosynthesis
MNILYLCDEYPPGQHGGIGRSVQLLARELVKQGHKITVAGLYSLGYGGEAVFEDEGVKVYRFRFGLDSGFFASQQSRLVKIANRLLTDSGLREHDIKKSLTAYHKKLEEIITENRIDLVEMPDYNDYIRFCKSVVQFPKLTVPVIVKMHGSLTYTRGRQVAPQIVEMEQSVLNQATAVCAVSRYVAGNSAAWLGYQKQIEVLYNGIETQIPTNRIERNPNQVIYTGALVAMKGVYQLAKAWNLVIENRPDARLLILGKGPQQKVLDHLSSAAIKTVTFFGHLATDELYNHLMASAVSVFPSYSEAFSLAPLEAMACGTAVINSARTSGPELVDDSIDGLLVDPDNVEQLTQSILRLLNNPAECQKLAIKGNQKVIEKFGITNIAVKHIAFYNKVLDQVMNNGL